MEELIAVVALFLGIPLLVIGGVWSVVRARSVNLKWMLAMIFLFPISLPAFCLFHWSKARSPMITTITGFLLTMITFYYLPE